MRVLVSLLLVAMMLGAIVSVASTSNTTNTTFLNSTQIQNIAQKIPAPPPNLFQEILNFMAQGYNMIVNFVQNTLEHTLLKKDPTLANSYANIITWLVTLTAIYITLTFVEIARKFIGYLLAIGWAFIIILLFLAH